MATPVFAAPDDAEKTVADEMLAEGGGVSMNLAAVQEAVISAWLEQFMQSGKLPRQAALNSTELRKRVVSAAVRTEIALEETWRRQLIPEPGDWDKALWKLSENWLQAEHEIDLYQNYAEPEIYRDALLFRGFNVPIPWIENALSRQMRLKMFENALLDDISESRWRRAWSDENTKLALDLFMIPRVPTSMEIDAAVQTRKDQMASYYQRERRLFFQPARTFVTRLFLPRPTDPTRHGATSDRIKALHNAVHSGTPMEEIVARHGAPRDQRSGGRRTLSRKNYPHLFELPKGSISPIEESSEGWSFYRIEGHGQEVERSLTDRRVRREIAAALLRESDDLPHANSVARQVRFALASGDPTALNALMAKETMRHINTDMFSRSLGDRIPRVGLAPELAEAVYKLKTIGSIAGPVRVRQDYIIARLTKFEGADPADWPEQKSGFVEQRKKRDRRQIVGSWITGQLRGHGVRVNGPALSALPTDALLPLPK